jgi:sulfur carrier protein
MNQMGNYIDIVMLQGRIAIRPCVTPEYFVLGGVRYPRSNLTYNLTMKEMSQMITIELNGQQQPLPPASTVSDLFAIIGSDGKSVAVVVNDRIIRPENRSAHLLQEGDRVELLIFAGGG